MMSPPFGDTTILPLTQPTDNPILMLTMMIMTKNNDDSGLVLTRAGFDQLYNPTHLLDSCCSLWLQLQLQPARLTADLP